MILILTRSGDFTAKLVAKKLAARGVRVEVFDGALFPTCVEVTISCGPNSPSRSDISINGSSTDPNATIYLGDITATWIRRPGVPVPHKIIQDPRSKTFAAAESRRFLTDMWNALDCLWVPAHLSVIERAAFKISQLKVAQRLGFAIPSTLATNDAHELLDFYHLHKGRIVSKSVGESIDYGSYMRYTQLVSARDMSYAHTLRYAPVLLQSYVPKRVELRITVVGKQIYATEIHSQESNRTKHDWRQYDLIHTPHRSHDLPDEIKEMCIGITEELGLCFAAIDMVLTPEGQYVFLELNPNGEWLWIEELTGIPISDALVTLLMSREDPVESRQHLEK